MKERIAVYLSPQPAMRQVSIEIFRLLGAIGVVFIHCEFPGTFGEIINCFSKFAVPFFFAVSGYFAYRADAATIRKRMKNILKLNICASLLYLLWGGYQEKCIYDHELLPWLLSMFSKGKLTRWILISESQFSEHLWYLAAILTCYVAVYLYILWQKETYNYYTLYLVGFCLLTIHLLLSSMATAAGVKLTSMLCRNALFFGLPIFALGIFIREHQDRLIQVYGLTRSKLVAIIFVGEIMSVIQWLSSGPVDMPLGTLFVVIALMLLLCTDYRSLRRDSFLGVLISKFGELSLIIYIVHPFWIEICDLYDIKRNSVLGETVMDWLTPVLIVLLSTVTGLLWILLKLFVRKMIFVRKKSNVP